MKKIILAALCAALAATSAAAQSPSGKTMRILVGFPPGQATDLVARMIADKLTASLGQTVIVENRPGQGGSLVLGLLAKSPPDGQTITLSALASYVVNPHLYKTVPYDTLKDLAPIGRVADLPMLLCVHPSVPAQTLPELIAYVKANPGKLMHSSSGNGTLSHLLMEDFKRRAGLSIVHVPYQGSPKAMLDLMAGNVQVGLDTITVTQPHVQSGRMRLIAAGTASRLPAFAGTPTIAEQGYPGFEAVAWLALSAPAGTPRELRERINADVVQALKTPEFASKLVAMGAFPRPGSTDEFGAFLKSEYTRWGEIVRASGAKVD